MPTDLLSGLNPDQLAAVTTPASALILAGAGSGKTRVLTTRIAWLIQQQNISPMGLMAVTFTNKAAKEMLTRLTALLPINTRGMWVGTFHGLCNRLLRTHHREAGLTPLFTILDSGDQLSAIKRTLRALDVDTEKYDPRQVQSFINQNKEMGLRADKVEAWDPISRHLAEYYAAYDAQCQREGAVDFAELLLRAHELLTRNALLREHYQERFRHVLVDEFQDTSRLQYEWLKLLKGPEHGQGGALFAVGDDDQSIYAFRGAHVGNMQQLMREYGIEAPIKLTRNYRSVSTILDAAQVAVIATMESAHALAAALLPPGSTQRDAFAEWLWGSLVTVQALGRREPFGLDGERLQGEVVYSAAGNVLKMGLEAESTETRARARQRYRACFEGGGLPDVAAGSEQLYSCYAIAGRDADLQGDGA